LLHFLPADFFGRPLHLIVIFVANALFFPIFFVIFLCFQERFHNLTRNYYREAKGAIIVFDQTSTRSFSKVLDWKTSLDQNLSELPVLIMQNKCDSPMHAGIPSGDAIVQWAGSNGEHPVTHFSLGTLQRCFFDSCSLARQALLGSSRRQPRTTHTRALQTPSPFWCIA
jgi:hypothetical protein